MPKRTIAVAWIVVSAISLMVGLLIYTVWKPRLDAERLCSAAQELGIGKASADDVLRLLKSSHGKTDGSSFSLSKNGDAAWAVDFENTWAHRLRLAPLTAFSCRFDIKGNVLRSRSMAMVSYEDGEVRIGAFVHEDTTTQWADQITSEPQEKYFRISGGYPNKYLGVLITPSAPSELRRLAYGFNFDCLTRFGGCKAYPKMLPVLGQKQFYWGHDPWTHQEKTEPAH